MYSRTYDFIKLCLISKEERKELKKNIVLKNKHFGNRCFIIGNGPSIKKIDLSLLEKEITFTVNQISRIPDFRKLKTQYHIWSDERFFQKNEDIEKVMKNVNSGNNPIVFYRYTAKDFIEETKLNENLNIRYFNGYGASIYKGEKRKFDYTKILPWFPTVIDYAISLAIYMGIKEIYLLGCDCTGFQNLGNFDDKDLKYGYEITNEEIERLKQTQGKDIIAELKIYPKIFEDYEILNTICKENNVKLINCTDGGLLNSIERKPLEVVLKENH